MDGERGDEYLPEYFVPPCTYDPSKRMPAQFSFKILYNWLKWIYDSKIILLPWSRSTIFLVAIFGYFPRFPIFPRDAMLDSSIYVKASTHVLFMRIIRYRLFIIVWQFLNLIFFNTCQRAHHVPSLYTQCIKHGMSIYFLFFFYTLEHIFILFYINDFDGEGASNVDFF